MTRHRTNRDATAAMSAISSSTRAIGSFQRNCRTLVRHSLGASTSSTADPPARIQMMNWRLNRI